MNLLKKLLLILFICFFSIECYAYILRHFQSDEIDTLSNELIQYGTVSVKENLKEDLEEDLEEEKVNELTGADTKDTPIVGEQQVLHLMNWKAIKRKDSFNNELQYYTPENVHIEDGGIHLIAKRETLEDKQYTSALIESENTYLYGYFEFLIIPPKGQGLFPAIWLLPDEDKSIPEIDIFEMIGSEPYEFSGVVHFEGAGNNKRDFFNYTVTPKASYKVAFNWTPEQISWYIDDQLIYETSLGVPQEYMYILVNLAVGGNWPGPPNDETIFPNAFIIQDINLSPQYVKRRE